MLKPPKIGARENWTVERRNRVDREFLQPAATGRAARLARDGSLAVADYLDRPRYPWSYTARTVRILPQANMDPAVSPMISAAQPFVLQAPGTGRVRRVACRDTAWPDNVTPTGITTPLRLRIERQTLGGVFIAYVMDGTTSDTLPFDVRDLDAELGDPTNEQIAVSVRSATGAIVDHLLAVYIEAAIDLDSVPVPV